MNIKQKLLRLIHPQGKHVFVHSLKAQARVLDVGCGNNSPFFVKTLRPDIHYVGLDIGVYNQRDDYDAFADEVIIASAAHFSQKIAERPGEFDAVISAHNLEHCDDYQEVTRAMIAAMKKGGRIYISFPCEESAGFPSRENCLNFYDDGSHKNLIDYASYLSFLREHGLQLLMVTKRYRPYIPLVIGLLFEPYGRLANRQAPLGGTWALFGFETIIVALKV